MGKISSLQLIYHVYLYQQLRFRDECWNRLGLSDISLSFQRVESRVNRSIFLLNTFAKAMNNIFSESHETKAINEIPSELHE